MKRIEVEFADSNLTHGWEHPDASIDELAYVRAIGFLKSADDNQVTITMANSALGLIFEKMTIPRGAIKSIKELRVK